MPRKIRYQDPDAFYFLTNRCAQQRFLLRPDPTMNEIIRGCLAWAAHKHDVDLAFFVFMSNHFHIGARFPLCNRQYFMRDFQRELAQRGNNHRDNRDGPFFEGRYKCAPILDDKAMWGRLTYTLNNPVEARLVPKIEHWPGVSSFECHRDSKPFTGKSLNKTKLEKLRDKGIENPFKCALEEYSVDLVVPPALEGKSGEDANQQILEHIESDRKGRLKAHTERGFAGAKDVLNTPWGERPENPDKSPQPLCHTTCKEKWQTYKEHHHRTTTFFKKASQRLRAGREATFPSGTIPPGFHRCLRQNRTVHPPRGP
jgi:REP element-mobilizing transposase RayT